MFIWYAVFLVHNFVYCTDISCGVGGRSAGKHSAAYKVKNKGVADNGGMAPAGMCSSRDVSIFLFKSLGKILYCKSE